MKKAIVILGLTCAVGMAGMAVAGSIDSPGSPLSGSGMYTLNQIYDYLTAGTTATPWSYFNKPTAGPGPSMHTTKQIYEAVATPFPQCDAAAADVKSGKRFFCTVAGSWGVQTGTASAGGALLKTGQTSVYCGGDDGYWRKGLAFSYSFGGDMTVYDNVTKLQWDARPAPVPENKMTWDAAIGWAGNLSLDGKRDWRLPNIRELQSLFVYNAGQGQPFVNKTYFPLKGMPWVYWSSTSAPYGINGTVMAAVALFGQPSLQDYYKSEPHSVMAVRDAAEPDPTPIPDPWYTLHGPSGDNTVVRIGTVYVATGTTSPGTGAAAKKTWQAATDWSGSLSWLDKADWRLPSNSELASICLNKSLLGGYTADNYWSSTVAGGDTTLAYITYFASGAYECYQQLYSKETTRYVRPVRVVP